MASARTTGAHGAVTPRIEQGAVRGRRIDAAYSRYLSEQRHGVLATLSADGAPQAKPVGYRYDADQEVLEIAGHDMERSAKFRNVAGDPRVAFTVSDVSDPTAGAAGVRFLEVRGVAERIRLEQPPIAELSRWIVRIHPRRLVSYNVAGPGAHAIDVEAKSGGVRDAGTRPAVGLSGAVADKVRVAVEEQVAELQAGLDDGDARAYNRHFAADVMWGSPYGATVEGYERLHAIHRQLHAAGTHNRSRYEIVRVLAPIRDIALAQVRRTALDASGAPVPSHPGETQFSEMALYVLVRRAGRWWLAAGQNTIVDIDHGRMASGMVSDAGRPRSPSSK